MPLRYIERAMAAGSIEEVWHLLVQKMETYGFDRLLYGFTRNSTPRSLGRRDDSLVLSSHDPQYAERFVNGGLYYDSPMMRWALEHVGACSWRWIEENFDDLSDKEKEVVAMNRDMGVTAGYTISFQDNKVRNRAAIALTARRGLSQADVDAMWQCYGQEIQVMCQVTHLIFTTLPHAGAHRELTQRQREVLEWVGDGKTMQDISTIMGVTPATVEKHLRLAREALEVETTAQAVLKASFQNQIFVIQR